MEAWKTVFRPVRGIPVDKSQDSQLCPKYDASLWERVASHCDYMAALYFSGRWVAKDSSLIQD